MQNEIKHPCVNKSIIFDLLMFKGVFESNCVVKG